MRYKFGAHECHCKAFGVAELGVGAHWHQLRCQAAKPESAVNF